MKKILPLVMLMFITITLFAQRNKVSRDHENFFRFGAKGGVNINKLTGQSYKDGFNYNFQAGAFIQINFSSRFGLQPEVNFVQTSSQFTNDANDIYYDLFQGGSQKKIETELPGSTTVAECKCGA